MSRLSELKDKDGNDVFFVVRHGPCQKCIDKGIGVDCPHFERAPWKSKAKDDQVKAIFKQQGKMELFEQEMRGQVISKMNFLVAGKFINLLRDRPLFKWRHPPRLIYLGIDPHGGGKTSETAIMALGYYRGSHVVSHCVRIAIAKCVLPRNSLSCGFMAFIPFLARPNTNESQAVRNTGMNRSMATLLGHRSLIHLAYLGQPSRNTNTKNMPSLNVRIDLGSPVI